MRDSLEMMSDELGIIQRSRIFLLLLFAFALLRHHVRLGRLSPALRLVCCDVSSRLGRKVLLEHTGVLKGERGRRGAGLRWEIGDLWMVDG